MSGELERAAGLFVADLDSLDRERILAWLGENAQSVDEVSRQWLRGTDAVRDYIAGLVDAVSEAHTELRDGQEQLWGDTGVYTCWIDQRYVLEGTAHQISAPTTLVFRRQGADWKLVLFHSIPLAEQPA
jgi:ketosteroid isomerase-like protein